VRTVGHIIGQHLPSDAAACRYGGDEFVIAVAQCTVARGRQVADDLCRAVNFCDPVLAGRPFVAGSLSISVGAASVSFDRSPSPVLLRRDVEVGESLFREADAALYRAKARGRNQVCVA
jgi:diguanylate cyclase (GGDEF)-like protein